MAAVWTTPRTWAVGELVTAAMMNQHVRDNLDWLKTPISALATWSSNFTTTSASYVDITSATVTLTLNGGGVDVFFLADAGSSAAATSTIQVVVNGAVYQRVITMVWNAASDVRPIGFVLHIPASALVVGSNTIRLQAQTNSGTLTIYGSSGASLPRLYVVERGS